MRGGQGKREGILDVGGGDEGNEEGEEGREEKCKSKP